MSPIEGGHPVMLVGIVVFAFGLVTLLAALRLFLLWRETGELPELLIAVLIFGVGTLGVATGFAISKIFADHPSLPLLRFVPQLGVVTGMSALSAFTWHVYHRDSALAKTAAAVHSACLLGMFGWAVLQGSIDVLAAGVFVVANQLLFISPMYWSAYEALRYWSAMKRRLKIGLADALVTNRFLLWAIATGTAGTGISIGAIAQIGFGVDIRATAWVYVSYALHGVVSATAFWLAFKPPRAYVAWIRGSRSSH